MSFDWPVMWEPSNNFLFRYTCYDFSSSVSKKQYELFIYYKQISIRNPKPQFIPPSDT